MNSREIQVLIVDDSKVARDLLAYIVESDPQLKVMAMAENGEEALEILKTKKPDVIITDIVMPKMDGFKFTRKVMSTNPIPIIVISGIYNREEINKSFQAIEAGALAILEKPKGIGDSQYIDTARFVIETIKALSEVKLELGRNVQAKPSPEPIKQVIKSFKIPTIKDSTSSFQPIKAIAIGASIGGPQAIYNILSALPADFPVPIFVVQHISAGFVDGLINWLKDSTQLKVTLAKNKEQALPGCVYVAPDKVHMEISKDNIISLLPDADTKGQMAPSIGRLFRSLAREHGPQGIGILLTGVGKDGAEDLMLMRQKGALTIVQDEKSAVKFDMAKEAIRLGAAQRVVPLEQIASVLETLIDSHSSLSGKPKQSM